MTLVDGAATRSKAMDVNPLAHASEERSRTTLDLARARHCDQLRLLQCPTLDREERVSGSGGSAVTPESSYGWYVHTYILLEADDARYFGRHGAP